MKTQSHTLRVLTCALFILALSAMAQAQATRTWVSGVGDDVNPCSRTAPCKTFAGAISKTAIGGEIDALDPGGFGTLTVTKSITVDGASGFGSTLASGVNGIVISIAVSANDPQRRVTLRRLSINGTGVTGAVGTSTGLNGIRVSTNSVSKLNVENCYIQNFTTSGIDIVANEGAAGARVNIKDTHITNTGTVGLQATNTGAAGFVTVTADNVRIENVTTGVIAKDRAFITMSNSRIHGCTTAGVSIQAPSNNAMINLESTILFSTGTAVQRGGAGTVIDLSNCSILNNSQAISVGAGTVNTHENNVIANNTPGGGAATPVGQQ